MASCLLLDFYKVEVVRKQVVSQTGWITSKAQVMLRVSQSITLRVAYKMLKVLNEVIQCVCFDSLNSFKLIKNNGNL